MAREAALALRETDRSAPPPAGATADSGAERASRATADIFSAMDVVLAHASADGPDESFRHLVDRVDVDPEIKARCLALVEGYHAADPDRFSVRSLLKNTAADERPGANRQFRFVGGYDGLVTAIFQRIDPKLCEVRLDTVVTAVSWGRRRVVVRTSAGEELTAPQLIVTVPLGVLKAGTIAFSPRLADKEDAIARLEMGDAERVSLCLGQRRVGGAGPFSPERFPDDGRAAVSRLVGQPPAAVSGRHRLGGRPQRAGAGPDERRRAGGRGGRRAGRGPGCRRGPRCARICAAASPTTGWPIRSPAARTATPAWAAARRATSWPSPIDGTLFFAGEATESDGDNGTVHGAIASGRRAARRALGRGEQR